MQRRKFFIWLPLLLLLSAIASAQVEVIASPQTEAGGRLSLSWSGEEGEGDFITIVKDGSPDGIEGISYDFTRRGKSFDIVVPDEAGNYELRYVRGSDRETLSRAPLKVVDPKVTLSAPSTLRPGQGFSVDWKGPNHHGDYLTIVVKGGREGKTGYGQYYTMKGNPLQLKAPESVGDFEVRYLSAQKGRTLGRQPFHVSHEGQDESRVSNDDEVPTQVAETSAADSVAEKPRGTISVISHEVSLEKILPRSSIELLVDTSASMARDWGGKTRTETVNKVFRNLFSKELSLSSELVMRDLGSESCKSLLKGPMVTVAKTGSTKLGNDPKGKRPLAESLRLSKQDLQKAKGSRLILLVTSGSDSCGADASPELRSLLEAYPELRLSIVGLAIEDAKANESLNALAYQGRGRYLNVSSPELLEDAILEVLSIPYQVMNGRQEVVATGSINSGLISLVIGKYDVRRMTKSADHLGEIVIGPGDRVVVQPTINLLPKREK